MKLSEIISKIDACWTISELNSLADTIGQKVATLPDDERRTAQEAYMAKMAELRNNACTSC